MTIYNKNILYIFSTKYLIFNNCFNNSSNCTYLLFYIKALDRYSRDNILEKLPDNVHCWYAPKNAFVDELMLKAAQMLHTNSKIIFHTRLYKKKLNKCYILHISSSSQQ